MAPDLEPRDDDAVWEYLVNESHRWAVEEFRRHLDRKDKDIENDEIRASLELRHVEAKRMIELLTKIEENTRRG